jgi:hypothetical protein
MLVPQHKADPREQPRKEGNANIRNGTGNSLTAHQYRLSLPVIEVEYRASAAPV